MQTQTDSSTEYLQVRLDSKFKKEIESLFDELGLSLTQAVRLFLKQALLQRGLPFRVAVPEEMVTPEEEKAIGKALQEIKEGKYTEVDFSNKDQVKKYFGI